MTLPPDDRGDHPAGRKVATVRSKPSTDKNHDEVCEMCHCYQAAVAKLLFFCTQQLIPCFLVVVFFFLQGSVLTNITVMKKV